MRVTHMVFYTILQGKIIQEFDTSENIYSRPSMTKSFIAAVIADCVAHPFHMMEARYVL